MSLKHIRPAQIVRLQAWWLHRLPFLFGTAYLAILLVQPEPVIAYRHLLRLLISMIAIAAFAHIINDWGDIEADRLVGKANYVAEIALGWRYLLAGGLLLLGLGIWVGSGLTRGQWGLLGAIVLLQPLYVFRPIRLKERSLLGVLADALHTLILPQLFILSLFHAQTVEQPIILILLIWASAWGIRSILIHQLCDLTNDQMAGLSTFVVQYGRRLTIRLIFMPIFLVEWVAGSVLAVLLVRRLPVVIVGLLVVSGLSVLATALLGDQYHKSIAPTQYGMMIMGAEQYNFWLPLLLAVALLRFDWAYAGLLLIHLCLFSIYLWRSSQLYRVGFRVGFGRLKSWSYWWIWKRFVKLIRVLLGYEKRKKRTR